MCVPYILYETNTHYDVIISQWWWWPPCASSSCGNNILPCALLGSLCSHHRTFLVPSKITESCSALQVLSAILHLYRQLGKQQPWYGGGNSCPEDMIWWCISLSMLLRCLNEGNGDVSSICSFIAQLQTQFFTLWWRAWWTPWKKAQPAVTSLLSDVPHGDDVEDRERVGLLAFYGHMNHHYIMKQVNDIDRLINPTGMVSSSGKFLMWIITLRASRKVSEIEAVSGSSSWIELSVKKGIKVFSTPQKNFLLFF